MNEGGLNAFNADYDLYHDESQIAGYWHGILFVPRKTRRHLLDCLATLRKNTHRTEPISLKLVDKSSGPLHRCTSGWLQVGVAALLQRLKSKHYPIPTGHAARHSEYVPFTQIIGARFVVFRVRNLSDVSLCRDYVSRVERTFAMGLKGGLGLFSKYGDKLCIRSVHFDGHKHYDRNLSLPHILNKIGVPPNGVNFASDLVLDSGSSDHREADAQSYDDCQLQQLADVLVSGFRTVLAVATHSSQLEMCKPLAELVKTWDRGPKGYSNSRWFKGFCISEGFIEDGQWQFARIENRSHLDQPKLFQ